MRRSDAVITIAHRLMYSDHLPDRYRGRAEEYYLQWASQILSEMENFGMIPPPKKVHKGPDYLIVKDARWESEGEDEIRATRAGDLTPKKKYKTKKHFISVKPGPFGWENW